jgi:hypothetical protein
VAQTHKQQHYLKTHHASYNSTNTTSLWLCKEGLAGVASSVVTGGGVIVSSFSEELLPPQLAMADTIRRTN